MNTSHVGRSATVPLFLFACLLLGGSSRSVWPNTALQIGAIVILAWTALAPPRAQSRQPGKYLALLCYSMVALVLLQLIPLPPAIWTALPGRGMVLRGYELLGQPLPWLPLSLTPYNTMTATLWLLPPLAIVAAILRLGATREFWISIVLGLAAFSGVLLGVLQVTSASTPASSWHFYSITNPGTATGFFANSNHMATLLIVTIPFLVALLGVKRSGRRYVAQDAGRYAILGGAILIMIVGLALNPSTAGIGLGSAAIGASILIRLPVAGRWAKWAIGGIVILVAGAIIAISSTPLKTSVAGTVSDQSFSTRATSFRNSLRAAIDVFPIGSGSGSFSEVYPAYENPDLVDRWYVNHVHNDFIELVLETGLAGSLLILLFLTWWIGRVVAIWQAPIIDNFARAATVASGTILAHSMVDFPLRTSALAAVFAMCVALMAGPRRLARVDRATQDTEQGARHLSLD